DRYLRSNEPRPLQEVRVSAAARAKGVRTPGVIAAAVYASGMFYRADLVTDYITPSADLAEIGFGRQDRPAALRSAAWHAPARPLPDLAGAGVAHADLNRKNVLIRLAGEPEACVLDLDRAQVRERASAEALWSRLQRSLRKWERLTGKTLDSADRAALEA